MMTQEDAREKKPATCCRCVMIALGLLVVAACVAVGVATTTTTTTPPPPPKPGFISLKNFNGTLLTVQLIAANKLINSAKEKNLKEKGIVMCDLNTSDLEKEICNKIGKEGNILVVDGFERDHFERD